MFTLDASFSPEDSRVNHAGYFLAYFVILLMLESLLSIVTCTLGLFLRQRGRKNFTEGTFEAVLQIAIRHH